MNVIFVVYFKYGPLVFKLVNHYQLGVLVTVLCYSNTPLLFGPMNNLYASVNWKAVSKEVLYNLSMLGYDKFSLRLIGSAMFGATFILITRVGPTIIFGTLIEG